jgi:hypothetical protein
VGEREAGSETGAKKRMRRKGCDEEPAARLWEARAVYERKVNAVSTPTKPITK